MIHEDPRAYLVGLQGLALLRAYAGHHDAAFTDARLAEVARVLAMDTPPVEVGRTSTEDGYRQWSRTYDGEDNAAFADEPLIRGLLADVPPGRALDTAAGTGRVTRILLERHGVVAVDSSQDMLDRNPAVDKRRGELSALPVGDGEVDLVVCSLALTHLPQLGGAFAEFDRVLAPGGRLITSDVHPDAVALGSVPGVRGPGGEPLRLPGHVHGVGDYLRAALATGLALRSCDEVTVPGGLPPHAATEPGPWDTWPYSLAAMCPEAAAAAAAGRSNMLVLSWAKAAR